LSENIQPKLEYEEIEDVMKHEMPDWVKKKIDDEKDE